MLILLPPSEGKTAPTSGPALELSTLTHPGLNATRQRVLDELATVSKAPNALELLGVGASLAAEVERNVSLRVEPTAPAREVYTGVLFDALALGSMTPTQSARADESVRIISGLWGAVSPADAIPAYRLSMGVSLGELGSLGALWRKHLEPELSPIAANTVIVDCRSSSYVSAWKPKPAALDSDWVQVKVLRELNGKRSVVSHNAKHTRGVLARHLLTRRGNPPRTAHDLLKAARGCEDFFEVTLHPGAPGVFTLEIVVKQ
ncbi:peroxide stress protein YaaA [Timonella senegalensis]|uniref:YaaA family protein n=1 Tax=Timonella senegalensis TaxID=1465825 RepID=UPI0028A8E102|nr:peroxide stress protein YaaA [Timonella senegalensis]